jgi:Zn finger protein HypA/HybF involved in hydrogenase expression
MAMIKFLCPNGHQLSAPENLVGKAGKCPKCSTAFIVPAPEEPEEQSPESETEVVGSKSDGLKIGSDVLGSGQSGMHASQGGSHSKIETDSIAAGSRPKNMNEEVFVFLCPNGHKLNGPPSLKGKLGQCPHCHSRFRIPTDEEIEQYAQEEADAEAAAAEAATASLPTAGSSPGLSASASNLLAEAGSSSASSFDIPLAGSHLSSVLKSRWKFSHELGEVLLHMWQAKGDLGEVEIELAAGEEKLTPEFYSPSLSQGDFAVFGKSDGMHINVVVIPWSSIVRCRVNKIDRLPPGLFLD